MLLAHLSDLHLGHRAYGRVEGGRNVRERDVAEAFQRAVEIVVGLRPDLILLAGDVFDRPDPPPGALVTLTQGLEALRAALPSTRVYMVAGARDTPRRRGDPAALAALDPFPEVEAVTEDARSVFLVELDTHLALLPHSAVVKWPYPEVRPHPEARWNVLSAYAGVATGSGGGMTLDMTGWDYVALGYLHHHQEVAPGVFYSGSLERVGPEPWREAAQEKGFLTYDLESGRSRFHPVQGRAVVALAPIRIPRGEAGRLPAKVREVTGEVPGGIEGKIVRLRIEGLAPREVKSHEEGLFTALREQALHLAIEVDDFEGLSEGDPLPLLGEDRGRAFRSLLDRVREAGKGEETGKSNRLLDLLGEMGAQASAPPATPGLERQLLLREIHGTGLPLLGELRMEGREGLSAWVGGDGRILQAFSDTLLWALELRPGLPADPSRQGWPGKPSVAVRVGPLDAGFWVRRGEGPAEEAAFGGEGRPPRWSLPAKGFAAAWAGAGITSPEEALEAGAALLAWVRGTGALDDLEDALLRRFPELRAERELGELSARDYERLRLESELADLRSQLRALADVPDRVATLEAELMELRAAIAEVAGDLGAGTMDWHRERQDAETHLMAYRDRARELRSRIEKLKELGPESPCPSCGRLLAEHFDPVLEGLQDEWEALVQDGKWWRRRWEQLEEKPEELKALEAESYRLNARFEDCTERLERTRSALRELDELRLREREVRARLEALGSGAGEEGERGGEARPPSAVPGNRRPVPAGARTLHRLLSEVRGEMKEECRLRLLHRGGRRLNRLTGGRILGLWGEEGGGQLTLVDGGAATGVEADEDRAAATVALRMALVELLAEEWAPLGSFLLGDPFDRMGEEDQLRALNLLRRTLSRVPQVWLLTRGSAVDRAPEFFDGVFEFRDEGGAGGSSVRLLPAGVGVLRLR